MVSLLARGVGLLVKSLAGLSSTQAIRCSSLPGALSTLQCSATRWFSKQQSQDDFPKRPLSSYFHFMVQQWPILVKRYPEAKMLEISKMISLEWKGLSESAKKPYIELSSEERLKYKDEVQKYKEKLSPFELALFGEKLKLKAVNKKHENRRELTILGKPKRPRTPYNIFMSEHFHAAKEGSITEKMKSLHEDWDRLPHSQKQMYLQLAQDDKIRYENEMKAWEKQMFEIGREDLLRRKAKRQLIKNASVMRKAKLVKRNVKESTKTADKWKNEE